MHPLASVFEQIYRDDLWTNGSGAGSDPANTERYRMFLERFIVENRIVTVIDLGCGDWRSSSLIDWSRVGYLGVDVVESVILRNQQRFQFDNVRFAQLSDEDELPHADLLIVKDVLQHLPNSEIDRISRFLGRFYVALVTNTVASELHRPDGTVARIGDVNADVPAGLMRPVDVLRPPFNWPGEEVLRYSCPWPRLGAWETKSTALIRTLLMDAHG
ncbi:class I SAM-dependent methyltransferase [Catellatospora paridis]|uniref:class I SAM-dependent methyltransferase n=1 Tax=Catellatospora paridis TaxID=1617086 RepID=UPI0012D43A5F|nr:class I SAM-dependent methyltransferase [Catellatospora paridis]